MRLFLAFNLACLFAFAQNYPVQLHSTLTQPHAVYLPDLVSNGSTSFTVQAEFNDLSELSIDVKLDVFISGPGFTLRTSSDFTPSVITLFSGVPQLISGEDLLPYLETQNLLFSGLDPGDYEERKVFPEGAYSICITMRHYWNPGNIQVSNEFCCNDWFILNDPPLLSFPACGERLNAPDPVNITFQWIPLHLSSPNLLSPAEYLFELWEIFPENGDPLLISQNSFPYFSVRTAETYYNYSLVDPPLINGKKYAWRVTVLDVNGAMLFSNLGRSTVCWFEYSDQILPTFTLTLSANVLTHRQVLLRWNEYNFIRSYLLQVRKTGFTDWFEFALDSGNFRLKELEPSSSYEARVKGVFGNEETDWSDLVTFTTHALPVYSCNNIGIPPDLGNAPPLRQTNAGMIIKAGQFEMIIKDAQAGTGPGFYSGTGSVLVFQSLKLNVRFTSVYLDESQTLCSGEVQAITEGISNWSGQWNYENSWFYNGTVDSIYTRGDSIIIIGQDGDTTFITEDHSAGLLITDHNGNQWVVNPDGSVVPVINGALMPVSTVPLSGQEMEILGRALHFLGQTYTTHCTDSLRNIFLEQSELVNSHVTTQKGPFTSAGEEGIAIFLGHSDTVPLQQDHGAIQIKICKEKEIALIKAQVIARLCSEIDSPQELNYLGRYLLIEGKSFAEFVRIQTVAGKSNQEIAELTALNGITPLVVRIIQQKMK